MSAGCGPDDEPYIVLEYVDGIDLRRLAWSMRKTHGGMPEWLAVHVISEVVAGLAHAHTRIDDRGTAAPIIHRDINQENILITKRGQTKLTDFGVACTADGTVDGIPPGKLPYMAPEVFAERAPEPRSDLFSVGVVLWELLTGRHLFRGRSPQEVIAQVCAQPRVPASRLRAVIPKILDEVLMSALSPDPAQRPTSAAAMHATLLRALESMPCPRPITPEPVAEAIEPHLASARVPRDVLLEYPVTDVGELLGIGDDQLYSEPGDEVREEGETTYAIIRRAPSENDEDDLSTDDVMLAYLVEEAPIAAAPGFVDTLDLAPGAHAVTPASAASTGGYDGPDPIWVEAPHGVIGPLRPARALTYLRDLAPETLEQIRLSANGARWVGLDRVAYLLDDELVVPTLELGSCEMQGRIEDVSMTAILGTFARGNATSRLLFARPGPSGVERYELQVSGGQIVAIHQNDLFFELWSTLLNNPYLEHLGLGAAFHNALKDDRRLFPRLPYEAQVALTTSRGLAKRKSMRFLFGWRDGRFGSTGNVLAHADTTSLPILPFLPRLIARSFDPDWISTQLAGYLRQPLWRAPTFQNEVNRLKLRKSERIRAEAFGHGRTLFESLEFANAGRADVRYGQVIAYLLLELGLLQETERPTITPHKP